MIRISRSTVFCLLVSLGMFVAGCGDDGVFDPTFGTLNIQIVTEGENLDDGYRILIAGPSLDIDREVAPEEQLILPVVEPGDYTVELTEIAANCSLDGNPRTYFVEIGKTVRDILIVVCV
jgi:hypothetical protein